MARKKNAYKKMSAGIYRKGKYLYVVISQSVIRNGNKTTEKKWISTGLEDNPENVKKAIEFREMLNNKTRVSMIDRNITMTAYVEYVLTQLQRQIKDTTYSSYVYRGNTIKKYFGNIKVKDLNKRMIEEFLDSLFIQHHMQLRTVKDIKVFFNHILEEAVKEGIIADNPIKEVKINKNLATKNKKEESTDDDFFSYEEVITFLNGIINHELYELFYLTAFFGLRREEVLGLRWSAINLKNKEMVINHTVTKGTKVNRENDTKTTSSNRVYPLTDQQVEMFKQLKKNEIKNRELFGKKYHDSDYILKHKDGTPYYPDHPSKVIKKLVKKMPELPQKITFHGLRSSCVSILVHNGRDIKEIQKWVGHADVNTTLKIYAKVKEKEAKKEILKEMDDLIPLKKYAE